MTPRRTGGTTRGLAAMAAAAAIACGGNDGTGPTSATAITNVSLSVARGSEQAMDGLHPIRTTVVFSRPVDATGTVSLRVCLSERSDPLDGGAGGLAPHCRGVSDAVSPAAFDLNDRFVTWGGPGAPPPAAYRYVHAVLYPGYVAFSPLGTVTAAPPPLVTQTMDWPVTLWPQSR